METELKIGLTQEYRSYSCSCCDNKKLIRTNHKTSCWDYCNNCSWKGIGFDKMNVSRYMFGSVYRRFDYVFEHIQE